LVQLDDIRVRDLGRLGKRSGLERNTRGVACDGDHHRVSALAVAGAPRSWIWSPSFARMSSNGGLRQTHLANHPRSLALIVDDPADVRAETIHRRARLRREALKAIVKDLEPCGAFGLLCGAGAFDEVEALTQRRVRCVDLTISGVLGHDLRRSQDIRYRTPIRPARKHQPGPPTPIGSRRIGALSSSILQRTREEL